MSSFVHSLPDHTPPPNTTQPTDGGPALSLCTDSVVCYRDEWADADPDATAGRPAGAARNRRQRRGAGGRRRRPLSSSRTKKWAAQQYPMVSGVYSSVFQLFSSILLFIDDFVEVLYLC